MLGKNNSKYYLYPRATARQHRRATLETCQIVLASTSFPPTRLPGLAIGRASEFLSLHIAVQEARLISLLYARMAAEKGKGLEGDFEEP